MLYENGRAREALPSYERAVRLFPDSGLLRIELAQALIELDRAGKTTTPTPGGFWRWPTAAPATSA